MSDAVDMEALLRKALSPVEPPVHLAQRLEGALMNITEMAADELESWELSSMRDPRNWGRPVAAVMLGAGAGAALIVLRARRRGPSAQRMLREAGDSAGAAVRDAQMRAQRLIGGTARRRG